VRTDRRAHTERVLTQAFDNATGVFRALARLSAAGVSDEVDGAVLVHTGSSVGAFNPAFVTRLPDDAGAMFRHIDAFYSEHGSPSVVYARGSDAPALDPYASAAGYARVANERGLLLSLEELELAEPRADLAIIAVRDAETLGVFLEVSARAFEVPADWLGGLDAERLPAVTGLTLYLGLDNHEPVSTGALYVSGSMAGAHIIGTVAEHRRRGIGEAMTWRVIRDGVSAGCVACALTSSEMSHGMYERMGFEHVVDYAAWERGSASPPSPLSQDWERG